MTYPAIIVAVAAVVISVLMVWVIPIFAKTFEDLGRTLPGLTQMVMNASEFMQAYWWMIGALFFSLGLIFNHLYKIENARRGMDWFFLMFPLVGSLIQKAAVAKVSRTMGTLLQSGVMILDGLVSHRRLQGI